MPLAAREKPHIRPSTIDYRKTTGTCYLQDVYRELGLRGIPRGTIRRLRVVALEFRAAGIGQAKRANIEALILWEERANTATASRPTTEARQAPTERNSTN